MNQKDIFGNEKPIEYQVKKPVASGRVVRFQNSFGRHITPYALFISSDEQQNPQIPENHELIPYTVAQNQIRVMCAMWGMKRTVCDEGLVASGNGKYLYMLAYGDVHPSRKDY